MSDDDTIAEFEWTDDAPPIEFIALSDGTWLEVAPDGDVEFEFEPSGTVTVTFHDEH